MNYTKCNAIVLRYADYKDSDRMLTLFSREQGKISASVKGVKKQNSKLRAGAELFALGEYVLAESSGRMTVTGYVAQDTYYPLRADLERLWCATLAVNMEEAVLTDQPDEPMFEILALTLSQLAYNDLMPYMAVMDAFIQDFLICGGIYPSVSGCMRCGGSAEYFSVAQGGLMCSNCAQGQGSTITKACVDALQEAGTPFLERLKMLAALTPGGQSELFNVLMEQASFCTDRRFKTAEYLSKL